MIKNFMKCVVCVGISAMIGGDLGAMKISDLTNSMEKICIAEQNVLVAQLSGRDGKIEKKELDAQANVFKVQYIYLLSDKICAHINDTPLSLSFVTQMGLFVETMGAEHDNEVEHLKRIFVSIVLDYESDKVVSLLPADLAAEALSENQKTAVAMFVTQLNVNGELSENFSHFFVGGAVNALSADSDINSQKILGNIIKKVPSEFLEEADYRE